MVFAVRKVNNKTFWDREAPPVQPWLQPEDLASDALNSLRTNENCLSVFLINALDSPDLDRVLAALGAIGPNLDKVDYAVFDLRILNELGITIDLKPGKTPDEEVNTWHRDLARLTATAVVQLGLAIRREAVRVARKRPRDMRTLIRDGIQNSHINRTKLNPDLLEKCFKP